MSLFCQLFLPGVASPSDFLKGSPRPSATIDPPLEKIIFRDPCPTSEWAIEQPPGAIPTFECVDTALTLPVQYS